MSALGVTVSGPRAEADVVLPDDVALAALLPGLALSYAGAEAREAVVLVHGLGALPPTTTLRAAGVAPGAVLNVFPLDAVPVLAGERASSSALSLPPEAVPAGRGTAPAPTAAPVRATEARWAWLGAHGGAGVSSLAGALGGIELAGSDPAAAGVPVVVVARTHVAGLLAAQELAMAVLSGDSPAWPCTGLVTVADGPGRLPRPLAELRRVVSGGYPRSWQVPWVEAWRLGEPTRDVPRTLRRLAKALSAPSCTPDTYREEPIGCSPHSSRPSPWWHRQPRRSLA